MPFLTDVLTILVVEDNLGDFVLIENYLKEQDFKAIIHRAPTFAEAESQLKGQNPYDAILLDLSLPDAQGEKLVMDIMKLAGDSPVLVLTGFSHQDFGIATLSLGVSDYLLKDDLSPSQLSKSISYSIERKRIGLKLSESEEKYQRLFHFSPLPMWVYDIQTLEFLDVNEAAVKHYGYTKAEFLSMQLPALWSFKNEEEYLERIKNLKNAKTLYKGIVQHAKKSGELMFIEIQSDAIDYDGKKARIVIASDITEKTKATKALHLSEQRFKALVQEGTDLIAILGPEGDYRYVSPTAQSILGIPADQFIGKTAFEFIHEDDRERVQQKFNQLELQKFTRIEPFRFMDANKNWRWIETKLTNMIHDPSVAGIVANATEVTERIQSELKINESIERYNIVAKATSDVIWDWNFKTDTIAWNENLREVLGYETTETPTAWWLDRIHPEEVEQIDKKVKESINSAQAIWSGSYRFRCADGTYKYFFDRGFLMTDQNGNPLRMIGSMQDITHQKVEEHRLKLLESVITNATDAVMITEATPINEPGPKIVYVNNAFTQMTGYTPAEAIGKSPRILQGPLTSRTDLNRIRTAIERGEPCEAEIINYRKNGEKFWLNIAIAPVADSTGLVTHLIAIQRDITERMNYIQAIEDQNERLKEISWTQSHIVRAPLARIMGLIEILPNYQSYDQIPKEILQYILSSAHELDHIIRDIVRKTEVIYNKPSDEV